MMPANRVDLITLACKDSNEEWKARQALLTLTQLVDAFQKLPIVSSKLLECGKTLGLFTWSATALPEGWRHDQHIADIMTDVVAKLAKDSSTVDVVIAESADIMHDLTPSAQAKLRADICHVVHSIEYQCLFLVYQSRVAKDSSSSEHEGIARSDVLCMGVVVLLVNASTAGCQPRREDLSSAV